MKEKKCYFNDSLRLDIYLIGYDPEGESIVFNVIADDMIKYTGVIDCYKQNGVNLTLQLLEKLKIEKIHLLCWTHPDKDHSLGMEELFSKLSWDSWFYRPENIEAHLEKIKKNFPEIYGFISEQYQSSKRRYNIGSMCVGKSVRGIPYKEFINGIFRYDFDIMGFSPDDRFTSRSDYGGTLLTENGYSIGLWLRLGDLSVIFTGDINDRIIIHIDREFFPKHVDYVKIPHHGSKYSGKLVELFDTKHKKIYASCTTIKQDSRNDLPNQGIIDKYKGISSHVFSTSGAKEKKFHYGIIKVSMDCTDEQCREHYFYGDADEI